MKLIKKKNNIINVLVHVVTGEDIGMQLTTTIVTQDESFNTHNYMFNIVK